MVKKYKNQAQLNSRVVRIRLDDYEYLKNLAEAQKISIADAVHKTIGNLSE
jgi:hypothetical protein